MEKITIPATNYGKGRAGKPITLIVCHWMAGRLAGADARFKKPGEQASAHYGIGGDGTIHQYVDEKDTAYHAGNFNINQESIGIEHEGGPNIPITDEVYKSSAKLIREICKRHNLPLIRSTLHKHNEFKATQCPGSLDLDKLIKLAQDDTIPQKEPMVLKTERGLFDEKHGDIVITFKGEFSSQADKDHAWSIKQKDPHKQIYTIIQEQYVDELTYGTKGKQAWDELEQRAIKAEQAASDWETMANKNKGNSELVDKTKEDCEVSKNQLRDDFAVIIKQKNDEIEELKTKLSQKADKVLAGLSFIQKFLKTFRKG